MLISFVHWLYEGCGRKSFQRRNLGYEEPGITCCKVLSPFFFFLSEQRFTDEFKNKRGTYMGKFTFWIALKMVMLKTNMLVVSQKAKKG